MATTRSDVLEFMRSQSLAVQASTSASGAPQAAVVGFVITDEFEVFFDTVDPELERPKERYFLTFPDGRERLGWPGLTYVRARPQWIRFSNFSQSPADTVEFSFD